MNFKFLIQLFIVCVSILSAQSIKNRLLVPLYVYPSVSFGYDSNYLKLSSGEMDNAGLNLSILGDSQTFDSDISRIKMKFLYSPVLSDRYETNINVILSHLIFGQLKEKSYSHYSMIFEQHLGPYNWIKIGYKYLPKYFIRYYGDRDFIGENRYSCNFSSEEIYISYSFPITGLSWIRLKTSGRNEFYNSHFTEFDQQKFTGQIEFYSGFSKRTKYSVSLSHGRSRNTNYNSGLISTVVDRSYILDKMTLGLTHRPHGVPLMQKFGVSLSAEQRLYDLGSEVGHLDDWKFYLESNVSIWSQIQVHEDISLKISYQYRNRDADSNSLGEYYWVEEVKDFSKHVVWFDFSYDLVLDLFY